MLNPFPLQFLSLLAYFLLRVALGSTLFYLGLKHYQKRDELKEKFIFFGQNFSWTIYVLVITEILLSGFILAGAYTQYAVLLTMILAIKMFVLTKKFNHPTVPSKSFYFLMFFIALSLFITGAGAFAFDLPI